jgi:glyoxylate reductase
MLKDKGYNVTVGTSKVPLTRSTLIKIIKKGTYDAILTLLTDPVDAEVLSIAQQKGIRIISNYAVGFNNIDVLSAIQKGIVVTNTPGQFSDSIAEHTVALTIGLSTRIVEGDRFMRKGKYKGWDPMILIGTDLSDKTLGLIGAGRIGERAAFHLVKGFNMKCVYYDVKRNETIEKELGAVYVDTPEGVLPQADVVSLHVPLLPSTTHLIDAKRLSMMKKTAFLINTSRGPVVDEQALVTALKQGVIAGAGLDVFEFEPKLARGLAKLDNVILTPHIASARENARNEMARLAAQNIIDVFEGRIPAGNVTAEMCR